MNISGINNIHVSYDSQNPTNYKSKDNTSNNNSLTINPLAKDSTHKNSLLNDLMEQKDKIQESINKLRQNDSKNSSSGNSNNSLIKELEQQLEDLNKQIEQEKANEKAKEQKKNNSNKNKSTDDALISLDTGLDAVRSESSAKSTLKGEADELVDTAASSITHGISFSRSRSDKLAKVTNRISDLESKIYNDLGNISNNANTTNSKHDNKNDKAEDTKNGSKSNNLNSINNVFEPGNHGKINTDETETIVDATEKNIDSLNSDDERKDFDDISIGSYIDYKI